MERGSRTARIGRMRAAVANKSGGGSAEQTMRKRGGLKEAKMTIKGEREESKRAEVGSYKA